jgi:hypothetical protein
MTIAFSFVTHFGDIPYRSTSFLCQDWSGVGDVAAASCVYD